MRPLVRIERWQALTPDQQRRFAPLCPNLVELASPADEGPLGLTALRRKMAAYRSRSEAGRHFRKLASKSRSRLLHLDVRRSNHR
jgi:hypothetical protein